MDALASVATSDVKLHPVIRTLCGITDNIILHSDALNTTYDIGIVKNCNVFLTGFTGEIGAYMARSLCIRGNTIYCLVRDAINPKQSAKERLIQRCKNLAIDSYLKKGKIKLISGNYNQQRLGITDKDWNLLSNEIDVIFNVGSRMGITMPWSKAVKGVLYTTNVLIRLSRTKKIKPILHVTTCMVRLPLYCQPGEYMCHGYALSKYVDLERLKYLHYVTGHPLKVLLFPNVSCKELHPPTIGYIDILWWFCLKMNVCPNIDCKIMPYVFASDICESALNNITFNKTNNILIYGAYDCSGKTVSWIDVFQIMKIVNPSMKLISVDAFNDIWAKTFGKTGSKEQRLLIS